MGANLVLRQPNGCLHRPDALCLLPAGYAPAQNLALLTTSLSIGVLLLVTGQWYFRHQERTFADVI